MLHGQIIRQDTLAVSLHPAGRSPLMRKSLMTSSVATSHYTPCHGSKLKTSYEVLMYLKGWGLTPVRQQGARTYIEANGTILVLLI